MKLIGFNFTKINIERKANLSGELKVNTNIDISEIVQPSSSNLNVEGEIIAVKFSFSINYEPNVAEIVLEGNLIVNTDENLSKEIIDQWKDKKIQQNFRDFIFNIIFRKSNLKAMQLEEEMNLPLHLPLPNLKIPDQTNSEKENTED